MVAAIVKQRSVKVPANGDNPTGLLYTQLRDRTVVLSDPSNILSVTAEIETVSTNGKTFTTTFDAAGPRRRCFPRGRSSSRHAGPGDGPRRGELGSSRR